MKRPSELLPGALVDIGYKDDAWILVKDERLPFAYVINGKATLSHLNSWQAINDYGMQQSQLAMVLRIERVRCSFAEEKHVFKLTTVDGRRFSMDHPDEYKVEI